MGPAAGATAGLDTHTRTGPAQQYRPLDALVADKFLPGIARLVGAASRRVLGADDPGTGHLFQPGIFRGGRSDRRNRLARFQREALALVGGGPGQAGP